MYILVLVLQNIFERSFFPLKTLSFLFLYVTKTPLEHIFENLLKKKLNIIRAFKNYFWLKKVILAENFKFGRSFSTTYKVILYFMAW